MNRWVRVGLLTALIEYLRGEPEPPTRTREPEAGPPSDPGEWDRLMASFATTLGSAAKALEKTVEASAAANRAADEGMAKLRALAEEAIRARSGQRGGAGGTESDGDGPVGTGDAETEATPPRRPRAARTTSTPRRRSPRRTSQGPETGDDL